MAWVGRAAAAAERARAGEAVVVVVQVAAWRVVVLREERVARRAGTVAGRVEMAKRAAREAMVGGLGGMVASCTRNEECTFPQRGRPERAAVVEGVVGSVWEGWKAGEAVKVGALEETVADLELSSGCSGVRRSSSLPFERYWRPSQRGAP